MTRVPLDVAARIAEVKPGTIRVWVTRGLIGRYADGFDVAEIMHFIDTIRNDGKARGAVMATHNRYQTRRGGESLAS